MKVFGHRGSISSFPENTSTSVLCALRQVAGSEFDIQRTSDGHLVVLHDDTLARTALPWSAAVGMTEVEYNTIANTVCSDLTLEQIRRVQVGWPLGKAMPSAAPLFGLFIYLYMFSDSLFVNLCLSMCSFSFCVNPSLSRDQARLS